MVFVVPFPDLIALKVLQIAMVAHSKNSPSALSRIKTRELWVSNLTLYLPRLINIV